MEQRNQMIFWKPKIELPLQFSIVQLQPPITRFFELEKRLLLIMQKLSSIATTMKKQ